MKKKIIFLSIFILVLLLGGVAIFYFTMSNQPTITYADTEAKYKTETKPAPTDGSLPIDHDSYSNIAYVLWVLEHTEHYSSTTRGTAVSVGQTQVIYNVRRVNGKEQLVDTVSDGLVTVGKQKYFVDGKVLLRDFVSRDGDNVEWKQDEPECITNKGYIKRYGWLPTQATAYIICKDTILEISETTALDNGLYSITLVLNPDLDYAPYYYQREIATNASSLIKPEFYSIKLEYIFDANWIVQEVRTQEQYSVKPKVAPITVVSDTNIVEVFDYENYEFDASAMNYFNQYKDLKPSDGEVTPSETTPLSYITGSLLGDTTKDKTFDVKIEIEDQIILGKLSLNISDLNNIGVKVSLEDLQIVFENNVVYIDYGATKIKCNINEIGAILEPLIHEIVLKNLGKPSLDISNSLNLNQIMQDLNTATIVEEENSVQLKTVLNLMGITLPLDFNIAKNGNDFDLLSISSNIEAFGTIIQVFIEKNENVEFLPVEGEYSDLKNLQFIIDDITKIIKDERFSLKFSMNVSDYQINGTAKIILKENTSVAISLNIFNSDKNLDETIEVIYDQSSFFVIYKNIKVKLTLEEVKNLLDKYMPSLPEQPNIELSDILTLLQEVDIKSLFQELTLAEDEIKLVLNLEAWLEDIASLTTSIKDTEEGFTIEILPYGLSLELNTADDFEIVYDEASYTDISGYIDLVEYIMNLIGKESFGMNIEGAIQINEESLQIVGNVNFYYNEKYEIEGEVQISYQGTDLTIYLCMIEKDIYITLYDYTIKINLETLPQTIEEILKKVGMEKPAIEMPNVEMSTILELIQKVTLKEDGIEVDLSSVVELIGILSISYKLNETKLSVNVGSQVATMDVELQPIEYKKVEAPQEYYDEKDILDIMNYVEDILKVIENQHAYITLSGSYEKISFELGLNIAWDNELRAQGKGILIYDNHRFEIELAYIGQTVYVGYENIKIKLNIAEYLKAIPTEGISTDNLSDLGNLLKQVNIEEGNIEILLSLGTIIEGLEELGINLNKTENGIEAVLSIFDLHLGLDTTRYEEIQVEEESYTDISGYIGLVEYFMNLIGKESFGMNIEGAIQINEESLQVTGNADFIFDSARNAYDIEVNLNLLVHDVKLELQVLYIQNKIFIVLYDNVIELAVEDLGELYAKVKEKFNLESSAMSMDLSVLVDVISQIIVHENSIELDLSSFLSFLTKVMVEYTLADGQYSISLDIDSLATFRLDIVSPTKAQLETPQTTLNKEDLFILLDDVAYLMDLFEYGAIQIEIADGKIHLNLNDTEEDILLDGRIDFLLKNNEIQLAGQFTVEGFGVIAGLDFVLVQDQLFITLSNQTVCLNLAELDSFIESALEILAPIVQLDSEPNLNINTNMDLKSLGFILSSNSISIDLDELVSKACQLCLIFELLEDKFVTNVSGSFESMLSVDLPISISKSDVKEIIVPTNYLTQDDILEILSYVVEVYELAQRKEFNLEFNTTINTDGRVVADIEGYLYIKLLDNQEFDARLKLYVNEYKNETETAWHQLDLQIISKTTIQTLSSDFADAMIFGTYGNNPNDVSAVVKVKSTYEGIENLISSVLELLNINTSSLSLGTSLENLDLRNIIDYIRVSQSEVSLGIPADILFDSMQDEKQTISFTLRKNVDAKLSGIEISNLYVSYTNLRSFMKLENLCLNLSEEAPLELVVPTDHDAYYDVSNIANLVEAFYNNALEKSFEITGTVTLTALSIINVNMPVLLKVTVDENGAPIIYVHMDMMNIGLGTLMMSKKNIYIYYKDNYVYIHRDDSKDANDRKIKIHYTEFLDNLVYYLMDYAMGLPDSILSLVNKTPEGDGFIDASQCINDVNIGTSEFMINLNLKEIADNNDLGKLVVTIASSLVAKTDELGNYVFDDNGNICYVPMITSIPNFEFVAVDVINLNSKNLTLSNIHTDENGNQIVLDVHQYELEAFTQDFDDNYNVDEEYIYSNGAWVSNGKLKHNVVFDMAEAGSLTRRYSELDKIDVPYVEGSIIPFETESGTKYYKLLGWYYDASYLNPVEDLDSIYMGNKALVYYAKIVDVTIQLEIHSALDEVYTLTTYEGGNISSLIEELYNIKNVDNIIYKFKGLMNEQGESISVDELTNGSYVLAVVWEEVHYAFYALYNGQAIELQEGNDTAFLASDAVIAKGNEYLVYAASKLTSDYIMKNFASLFVLNEEMERFELELLDLADTRLNAYDLITFDVPKEELNTKGYYGFFIPKSTSKDITELLPNGTYDTFEINAWVSDSSTYYSLSDIKEIAGAQTLTAYVSTQLSYFEFESISSGATISAYTGTAPIVIFPEYALLGGKYVQVVEIKEMMNDSRETYSAFTENTTMRTLVFNESLARIGGNAFKNCDGLENVYFSKNLLASNVAKDAFYFVKTGALDFENALKQAKKIYFHCSEQQASEFNLLACKYNKSKERYYGKVASEFMGIGKADLTHSFVKEDVCISNVSYTAIKNL